MTGDSIHLKSNLETEKLDSLKVLENAFIVEDKARKAMFDERVKADKKKMSKREVAERKALFDAKEEQIKQSRQLVKDANKQKWALFFSHVCPPIRARDSCYIIFIILQKSI